MIKRVISLLSVAALVFCLTSCGEEEDTYSFYDAASQRDTSSITSSEVRSEEPVISTLASDTGKASSEVESVEQIKVTDAELEDDKDDIQKTAQRAMEALLDGDLEGLKKAQPKIYDTFLENEYASAMISSSTAEIAATYGEDAEISLEVTDIKAGTTADIDDMQILVDSFGAELKVETVRTVTFKVSVSGSLGSDSIEEEVTVFYADDTWYIAVFADMDMSQFENFDPSAIESMPIEIPEEVINDILENMQQS